MNLQRRPQERNDLHGVQQPCCLHYQAEPCLPHRFKNPAFEALRHKATRLRDWLSTEADDLRSRKGYWFRSSRYSCEALRVLGHQMTKSASRKPRDRLAAMIDALLGWFSVRTSEHPQVLAVARARSFIAVATP